MSELQKKVFVAQPDDDCDWWVPIIAYTIEEAEKLGRKEPIIKEHMNEMRLIGEEEDTFSVFEIKGGNAEPYPLGVMRDNTDMRKLFLTGLYDMIETTCDKCKKVFHTQADCRRGNGVIHCEECWE